MKVHTKLISLTTRFAPELVDITDRIKKELKKSKILNGIVTIFSRHTTAAIRINENERGIKADFARFLNKLLPADCYYAHNDLSVRTENLVYGRKEPLNAHSHLQSFLMGASETIPIVGGKLMLGQWQRVFLLELDHCRRREIVVHIQGDPK